MRGRVCRVGSLLSSTRQGVSAAQLEHLAVGLGRRILANEQVGQQRGRAGSTWRSLVSVQGGPHAPPPASMTIPLPWLNNRPVATRIARALASTFPGHAEEAMLCDAVRIGRDLAPALGADSIHELHAAGVPPRLRRVS